MELMFRCGGQLRCAALILLAAVLSVAVYVAPLDAQSGSTLFVRGPEQGLRCAHLPPSEEEVRRGLVIRMQFTVGEDTVAHRIVEVWFDRHGRPRQLAIAVYPAELELMAYHNVVAAFDSAGTTMGGVVITVPPPRMDSDSSPTHPESTKTSTSALSIGERQAALAFGEWLWEQRCPSATGRP